MALDLAVGNAGWYLGERALRLGGGFVLTLWMARVLGPVDFGTYAYALAVVTLSTFCVSLAIESLVLRDLSQDPSDRRGVAGTYLIVRSLGSVGMLVVVAAYFLWIEPQDRQLLVLALVMGLSGTAMALDVVDLRLQALGRARLTSSIRMGSFLLGFALKALALLVGAPIIWLGMAFTAEYAVAAACYVALGVKGGKPQSNAGAALSRIVPMLREGRFMIASGLTVIVYSKIDALTVGRLFSREDLANYALATAVVGALAAVGMSMAQAQAPVLARAHAGERSRYLVLFRQFLMLMAGTSVGLATLTWLVAPVVVQALAPQYQSAASVMRILVWAVVPVYLGVATSQILVNERWYAMSLIRTGLGLTTAVVLLPIGAPWLGLPGVATAMVASSAIATLGLLASGKARRELRAVLTAKPV